MFFAVTGLVLGLLGVIVGLYFGRLQVLPPRRSLKIRINSLTPLILHDLKHSSLKVSIDGADYRAPHFLHIALSNIGKFDIGSKDFDGDRPSALEIPAQDLVPLDSSPNFHVTSRGVEVPPQLIKTGKTINIRLLVEGRPTFSGTDAWIESPLIDTPLQVSDGTDVDALYKIMNRSTKITVGAFAAVAAIAFAAVFSLAHWSAQASVNKYVAQTGESLTVQASNLAADRDVNIRWCATADDCTEWVSLGQSSKNGDLAMSVIVPDVPSGAYTITVDSKNSRRDATIYDVVIFNPVKPSTGPARLSSPDDL